MKKGRIASDAPPLGQSPHPKGCFNPTPGIDTKCRAGDLTMVVRLATICHPVGSGIKERVLFPQTSTERFDADRPVHPHGGTRAAAWICHRRSSRFRLRREADQPIPLGSQNRGPLGRAGRKAQQRGVPMSQELNCWSRVRSCRILVQFQWPRDMSIVVATIVNSWRARVLVLAYMVAFLPASVLRLTFEMH